MKLYEIVNAASSLRRIVNQEVSLKTAYRLSLLVDKLNPHLAYFDQHQERVSKLADNKDAELDELLNEEVQLEFDKVEISLEEKVSISAMDVLNLKDFVTFSEPEN